MESVSNRLLLTEQGIYPGGSLAGGLLGERDAGASEESSQALPGSQVNPFPRSTPPGGLLAGVLLEERDAGASEEGSPLKQHPGQNPG
jgi:hypothetical protein